MTDPKHGGMRLASNTTRPSAGTGWLSLSTAGPTTRMCSAIECRPRPGTPPPARWPGLRKDTHGTLDARGNRADKEPAKERLSSLRPRHEARGRRQHLPLRQTTSITYRCTIARHKVGPEPTSKGDQTPTVQSRLDEISKSGYIFSRKKKRTEVPPLVLVGFDCLGGSTVAVSPGRWTA